MNRLYQIAVGAGLCVCTAGIAEAQLTMSMGSGSGGVTMQPSTQSTGAVMHGGLGPLFAGITLTATQQDSLKKIKAAEMAERTALMKGHTAGTRPDSAEMAKMHENMKKWTDAEVALLTPEQKAIYDKNVAAHAQVHTATPSSGGGNVHWNTSGGGGMGISVQQP